MVAWSFFTLNNSELRKFVPIIWLHVAIGQSVAVLKGFLTWHMMLTHKMLVMMLLSETR